MQLIVNNTFRQTEKLIRQLQGMNFKSMLDLKTVSRVSKYIHRIKNCLAKMPNELLIDSQIAKAI
jgi:pyruvate/oxaloacetate carboxyltransferase